MNFNYDSPKNLKKINYYENNEESIKKRHHEGKYGKVRDYYDQNKISEFNLNEDNYNEKNNNNNKEFIYENYNKNNENGEKNKINGYIKSIII
jgi:hypothetical protein